MLVKLQAKIESEAGVEATRYITIQFLCTNENIPDHFHNQLLTLNLASS